MKTKVLKVLNEMKALMRKRVPRIILIVVLCGVGAFLLISAFKPDSAPASENQVVTVQRGDLSVDISAAGNLALSVTEDLAFEISGTVEEVLVEEGDSVEEGQLLVKLDTAEWESELTNLGIDLIQAEINLDNARLALDQAEEKLSDLSGIDRAIQLEEIDILELKLELAEARFEEAKEAVAEALEASPEIVAPFDGFIISVNVEGGDEVKSGTVAVTLADPNKFEADILVSEMDIFQIKLGGEAAVQVDAVEGLSLRAEVTHIAPTATIQSGVVNYEVKVEIQSLEEAMQEQQQARQEAMPDIPSGELPESIQQAIDEGRITQEQAEEMMERMQEGQEGWQDQVAGAIPEGFQLREGLTVTVSIVVDEASDVLLVPNSAIITQGRRTYVQVLSPDGTIEQRAITTGISDWQYTEVTDGLSEGEQVIVPQDTTTTSTTQQPRGPGGEVFFFRGGGP